MIFLRRPALFLFTSLLLFYACKKQGHESAPDGLPASAETKPQFNNTSFGVYKGVVIGSTGTIVVRINNGDNLIKAFLNITNTKDTLSTTQQVLAGQSISGLTFTGRVSAFNFSADANGNNVEITDLVIAGHPGASAIAVHENSTDQVYCYEGTFTGERTGNICFIRSGPLNEKPGYYSMKYLAKQTADDLLLTGIGQPDIPDTTSYTHYFTGSTLTADPYLYFAGKGKFTGNNFSGYWTSYNQTAGGNRGNFNCTRTY